MTFPSHAYDPAAKRWVLALTSVGSLMAVLDAMAVAATLGTIRTDLGASLEALEWTMNAYNLSFAVLLLAGAALGDRFGRRRMFVAGLAVFVAASAACALSTSAAALIVARAVQGAGAALIMPLAMTLLSAAFPPQERGKALGLFSSITGLGLIAGPVLGGAIAAAGSWPWIFWINIPLGVVLIPLARARLPESFGAATAVDAPGVALVTGSAFAVVWALMRGNEAGWAGAEVLTACALAALFAIAFVVWERRAAQPMIPMRFFGARGFSSGIAACFLFCAGMYGVVFLLPQFLQLAQGRDALGAGLRLLPWTAMLFVFAPLGGVLVNRLGERRITVAGLVVQALGQAWIARVASPDVAYATLVPALVLAGAGVSLAMPAAQNAVFNAVARADAGKASGVYNMARFLGGMAGIAIAAAVFQAQGGFASPAAFSDGFGAAMTVSAILSLAAAAAGLWLPAQRRTPAATEERTGVEKVPAPEFGA